MLESSNSSLPEMEFVGTQNTDVLLEDILGDQSLGTEFEDEHTSELVR